MQNFVREGRISVGHAKVILGLADEKNQKLAAERVIKEGLNVRQTEGLVAKLQTRGSRKAARSRKASPRRLAILTSRIWRRACAKCSPQKCN